MSQFGRQFKEQHFTVGPAEGVNYLNHGAYGLPPTVVHEARMAAITKSLAFPDQYWSSDLTGRIVESRRAIAAILDAELENLVFVPNSSTAFNTVVRSFPFQTGDKVVCFSHVFKYCENTLEYLKDSKGIETITVDIELPTTHKKIVNALRETLDKHPDTKLVLTDLIASMPSIRMPYEQIVELCRERGVLSFVDGAHGLGIAPICLRKIRPDFFTTNAHKWFYAPRSAAAFYADPEHHKWLASMPLTAAYVPPGKDDPDRFAKTFNYVGAMDYTVAETLPAVVKFHTETCGGLAKVIEYQNQLSKRASELVCKELGVREISDFGPEFRCAMFTVNVPVEVPDGRHQECVSFLMDVLNSQWKTAVAMVYFQGEIYMRFSATVYLELQDFERAIAAIQDAIGQWEARSRTVQNT